MSIARPVAGARKLEPGAGRLVFRESDMKTPF